MSQNTHREVVAIPAILSYFSLATPIQIVSVKEGISNHSYLVRTGEGTYIVKFLINQTAESVENDVAIQNQLRQVGINTPVYLQNAGGTHIYVAGDIRAVISRKIDGTVPRKASPQLAQEFGRMLALFHVHVTDLPHPNDKGLMIPKVSGIQSDIFSYALPKGVNHGDFHLGNALLSSHHQDEIIAILDFEEAGENLFLVDLAVTIMGVCFSDDECLINPKLLRAAIRGYQIVRELTPTEKSSFQEAVRYTSETWIKWFREHGYERYAKIHQSRLNSVIKIDFSQVLGAEEN